MIYIYGDSNFRDTMDVFGEKLSLAVKDKINFYMNTSNESLRTALEKISPDQAPKILVFGAPLNEIAHKIKTCKKQGRDETIKNVIDEQNKIINVSANSPGRLGAIHLMVQPFIRQDPAWMEERVKWASFCVGDFIASRSSWNVGIGNAVGIVPSDLGPDKIHLNESGMEKLFKVLEKDLLKCKENLGEGEATQASQDWASQVIDEPFNEPPTPETMKKRQREEQQSNTSDEEDEAITTRRAKRNKAEDKMDKMMDLLKEMKEDNKAARAEVTGLTDKVTITDKKVDDLKLEFDGMKEEMVKDGELTAEMREDIDGLENENLKATVIVRKLKAAKPVPKDKKVLRTYVQDLARVLVCKVIGSKDAGAGVKYAATLYSFVDPTKKDNKEGLVPPFKICFNCKDDAVYFRTKAVKMAKAGKPTRTFSGQDWEETAEMDQEQEEGASQATDSQASQETQSSQDKNNICEGAYFSFYQTAATRFRTTLMWAVADALKSRARQVWVSQGNKPTLQIKEGGKVVKTLTFVQTMTEYKEKIGPKILEDVKKAASKIYSGHLEKTFIVIKD